MHGIYELKETLCKELEEYGEKRGALTGTTLEVVDKLAHTIKNLDKIIEKYEEEEGEYSERGGSYRGGSYANEGGQGGNRGGGSGNMGGGSYARGRGRNARRDSMGRYSSRTYARDGGYSRDDGREDMIADLEDLMQNAPTPQIRQSIERLIGELENA